MRLPLTINIQTGRKLADKTRDEILSEIKKVFLAEHIRAVQVCYDTVRVTFYSPEIFKRAKESPGLYIFGLWCNILGGGPPVTVINLFDYPFEGEDAVLEDTMSAFGEVKRVRHQSFVSDSNIFTGTRLVSIVLRPGCTLPRFITINGCICRIWYRGQPLICNLCAVQGHKSVNCPNKDKCRRCGESGHFARACPNPWGDRSAAGGEGSSADPPADPPADPSADPPLRPPVIASTGSSSVTVANPFVDASVPAGGSLAGLSVGPSVCSSAEVSGASGASGDSGALSAAASCAESAPGIGVCSAQSQVASVVSEPEIGVFSSQSQVASVVSEPEIGVFSSQSQAASVVSGPGTGDFSSQSLDASAGSSSSVESSAASQSILCNVDNPKVGNNSNGSSVNNDVVTLDLENVNSEISSVNDENENSHAKNADDDSVVSSMELDASGPSNEEPPAGGGGGVDGDVGAGEHVGGILSRIPRIIPRKLIAKAQKPSKSAKFGQGKHSKLPVVLPSRPGRK